MKKFELYKTISFELQLSQEQILIQIVFKGFKMNMTSQILGVNQRYTYNFGVNPLFDPHIQACMKLGKA